MDNLKNKVKAVIFDMDGTIVQTEHIWQKVTRAALEKRGFSSFSQDQEAVLCSLSGIGLIESAQVLKKKFNLVDDVYALAEEKKQHAIKLFAQKISFINGFENFHKRLEGLWIPTSVATNADDASVKTLTRKLKLKRFFGQNIYNVSSVNNRAKPDPALFLHAAKQLNVKPYECVVFEDSLFGFQAAQAAGMRCIAIKNKLNKNLLHHVDDAIDSYDDAEEALSKIS